jgi:imidazolonepropionase-like amidohydrolase
VPQAERLFTLSLQNIRHLWDEGVIVAFGTDSNGAADYSPEGRFLAEAQALNRVLSNEEVIESLTRNAAIFLEMGEELGTLEPGKIADIAIIDGDPLRDISVLTNAVVVIQGGRVVVDNR